MRYLRVLRRWKNHSEWFSRYLHSRLCVSIYIYAVTVAGPSIKTGTGTCMIDLKKIWQRTEAISHTISQVMGTVVALTRYFLVRCDMMSYIMTLRQFFCECVFLFLFFWRFRNPQLYVSCAQNQHWSPKPVLLFCQYFKNTSGRRSVHPDARKITYATAACLLLCAEKNVVPPRQDERVHSWQPERFQKNIEKLFDSHNYSRYSCKIPVLKLPLRQTECTSAMSCLEKLKNLERSNTHV